ncbi:hypothetical protein Psfp_02452 [Pelotomaculum sp. FP]|uniref:hypothetical protein n=1 Tax=Pelotomaculum sp. FP TaxID=261474 RepID=UPI001104F851|nr:hypothetical protein [Pelotomaculum sp. FP]TEB15005.1 hypothetical protein Psfp_02452 [Pelotomaculum sp. FP]
MEINLQQGIAVVTVIGKENLPGSLLSADTVAVEGMVCGGAMEVFIEPVEAYKKVQWG